MNRKSRPRKIGVRARIAEKAKYAQAASELKQAAEQQAATAEILKVIARSPSDVQPVFETIVRSAVRLCGALFGSVYRFDGEKLHWVAHHNFPRAALEHVKTTYPRPPDRSQGAGRAILTRSVVRIEDILRDAEYRRAYAKGGGWRRVLAVPMVRSGKPLGTISVAWANPGPIPDSLVALLEAFADQAVIAIENARLFNETKEALEQQTATAEILRVISGNPTDEQPVFDAIVQSASRLFDRHARIRLVRDGLLYLRARSDDPPPGSAPDIPMPITPDSVGGRVFVERKGLQVADTHAPDAPAGNLARGNTVGYRSLASAPLIRDDTVIGMLAVFSPKPGALSDKQMALLTTFASQAVIAIENARLFRQLQTTNTTLHEALEQQTATADILKVISRSTTDVKPVFETIIRTAVQLCDGAFGMLFTFDGRMLDIGAAYNNSPGVLEMFRREYPQPADRTTPSGKAIVDGCVVNLPDILDAEYSQSVKDRAQATGWRGLLTVPLTRNGAAIGAIAVTRREAGAFDDSYVALLQTFADQAVIAIENVRLFNETKEALEQQTATAEILKVISSSPTDITPVLTAVATNAKRLCEASDAVVQLREGNVIRFMAHDGNIPVQKVGEVLPISRGLVTGRALLEGRQIHVHDHHAEEREFPEGTVFAKKFGFRRCSSRPSCAPAKQSAPSSSAAAR